MVYNVIRGTVAVDQRRHELVKAASQQRLAAFGEHQDALAIQRFDMEMRLETGPMKRNHRLLDSTSLAMSRAGNWSQATTASSPKMEAHRSSMRGPTRRLRRAPPG